MATLSRRTEAQSSKRAAVEARVLEATEELLAEGHAFADLKVEQIATRAGIGRSAFYFYFRDKRELLMRLSEGIAELLYAEAEAWWSGDGDGPTALRSALERVLTLYRDHAVVLRAAVEASSYDESVAVFWRALVGRFVDATRRRIEEEQEAGRVGTLPAEDVSFALSWMTERAMYQRHVQGGDLAEPDFVASLVRIWSGAIYGRLET
jgi:TetR/AcrR family transcriptional regulator, ethionamide resistance regulator